MCTRLSGLVLNDARDLFLRYQLMHKALFSSNTWHRHVQGKAERSGGDSTGERYDKRCKEECGKQCRQKCNESATATRSTYSNSYFASSSNSRSHSARSRSWCSCCFYFCGSFLNFCSCSRCLESGHSFKMTSKSLCSRSHTPTSSFSSRQPSTTSTTCYSSSGSRMESYHFRPSQPTDWCIQNYRLSKLLQRGGFASVFKATNTKTNQVCAFKVYSRSNTCDTSRETDLLSILRHVNVVSASALQGFTSSSGHYFYFVTMPLFDMDLLQFMQQQRSGASSSPSLSSRSAEFNWLYNRHTREWTVAENSSHKGNASVDACSTASLIMLQVCRGLSAIHALYFAHGDLKPENVLIADYNSKYSKQVRACICDLGSAIDLQHFKPDNRPVPTTVVQQSQATSAQQASRPHYHQEPVFQRVVIESSGRTLSYAAPELVLCDPELVSFEVDVFSIGCIFAELLTHGCLFVSQNDKYLHLAQVQALTNDSFTALHTRHSKYFTQRGDIVHNAQRRAAAAGYRNWDQFFQLSRQEIAFVKRCCKLDPAARHDLAACTMWFAGTSKRLAD